ncbi:MAG: hypothetical protein ACON5F_13040 [Jejuia sp.]
MTKKQRKRFYSAIFFAGLILIIWEIKIFRKTVINLIIPLSIILIVGIIAFILDFKNYKKTYDYGKFGLYLYSSMHYIVGFGFIACSVFMLTNYYLADKDSIKETYDIVDKSSMSGSRYHRTEYQPLIRINYKREIKELVFSHKYYDKMEFYETVELEVRKGYFGFDILESQKIN